MAEALAVQGDSATWSAQRKNHLRIFERFRASTPELAQLYPTTWEQLTEATLCPQHLQECVYAHFAKYLLDDYEIEAPHKNAGQKLGYAVMVKVLAGIINHAKDRFIRSNDGHTKRFLDCLDPKSNSEPARWFRALKHKMERECMKRAVAAGEEMDGSEGEPSASRALTDRRCLAHADRRSASACMVRSQTLSTSRRCRTCAGSTRSTRRPSR